MTIRWPPALPEMRTNLPLIPATQHVNFDAFSYLQSFLQVFPVIIARQT